MEYQAVLDAVRSLPMEDQERLVDQIQDELHSLSPEQIKEIDRRIAAHDADPSRGIPWQAFEAHIDKRLEELGE